MNKIKIWAGVGTYVLAGVGASALLAVSEIASANAVVSASAAPSSVLVSQSSPAPTVLAGGGEGGGEGGEGGGEGGEGGGEGGEGGKAPTTFTPSPTPAAPASQGGEGGEGSTPDPFQDELSGAALLNSLKSGGYVIYFRHAQTEKDYADQINAKMGDCSTQRMLSATGWQQAKAIGTAFERLQIPVGQVYSSEYCRAWQTADLAFGHHEATSMLNFLPFETYTEAQTSQMRAAVMPMLTAVPATGTNTVIVGHDDVFEAASGIYPEPQGVAYILKPDGQGSFDIVANMLVEDWGQL